MEGPSDIAPDHWITHLQMIDTPFLSPERSDLLALHSIHPNRQLAIREWSQLAALGTSRDRRLSCIFNGFNLPSQTEKHVIEYCGSNFARKTRRLLNFLVLNELTRQENAASNPIATLIAGVREANDEGVNVAGVVLVPNFYRAHNITEPGVTARILDRVSKVSDLSSRL